MTLVPSQAPAARAAKRRFRHGLLGLLAGLALTAAAGVAQVELLEPEAVVPRFSARDFLTLSGTGCAVRFTPGSLDRADHLLRRLELVTVQLNKWSEVPVPTAVYLVSREEWLAAEMPGTYGVPIRMGPTTLVTAAAGDAGTVELWSRLLGTRQLPMVFGNPLRGTASEAATMAIADVLLQVETARGMVQRSGLLGSEVWIGELAAHVAALAIFRQYEEARLPEIAATFARLGLRLGGPRESAADYHPALNLGTLIELENWLWFQAKFHEGARILLEKDGKNIVQKLKKLSKKNGGSLLRADLEQRYPGLSAWLSSGLVVASSARSATDSARRAR